MRRGARGVTRIVTGVDSEGRPFADVLHIRPREVVDGRHFSTYAPEVTRLKRLHAYPDALRLLERVLPAVFESSPPAPWFVEALAVELRRVGRHDDERALLARYVAAATAGTGPRHEALLRRHAGL